MIKYSDHIITAALRYYAEGHSRYECAERFGFTHGQIMYFAKTRGVHGGMSKQQQGEYAKAVQKKASKKGAETVRERGNLSRNDRRIRKEWSDLNNELIQWRKAIEIFEDALSAFETESKAFNDWVSGEYYFYKSRLIEFEPQLATCKHCGKKWLFWPSREKYAHHKPPTFCSVRCNHNHRYNREPDNHRHRAYKHGVVYESGITLEEIEERDGGVCYLCGGKTNRDDKWITKNGRYGHGATYPSQDHVIPIVRGGNHTRDNIKLAHRQCNSIKSDKLLSELQLPFSIPQGALHSWRV